jgi:hypothetical protein
MFGIVALHCAYVTLGSLTWEGSSKNSVEDVTTENAETRFARHGKRAVEEMQVASIMTYLADIRPEVFTSSAITQ